MVMVYTYDGLVMALSLAPVHRPHFERFCSKVCGIELCLLVIGTNGRKADNSSYQVCFLRFWGFHLIKG